MKDLLWLDDDERLIELSSPIFAEHGFAIHKATNTTQALKVIREHELDGVLLDVHLANDENGLDLLRELRDRHPELRVAIFTAYPEYDDHALAEAYGAAIYLAKVKKHIPLNTEQQRRFFEALHRVFPGAPCGAEAPPMKVGSSLPIRVLFLGANPSDTTQLALGNELRAIDQALQLARFRDSFELEQQWAVRVEDLQRCLMRYQPHVVHFSGHGSQYNELILEDQNGRRRPVSSRAISTLFSLLKDNIRCVVLNACFSEAQADAIAQHVECVVGMSQAIKDASAIAFAASFYEALANGRSVRSAFDLGCNRIDLESLAQQDVPKLYARLNDSDGLVFVHKP